MEQTLIFFFRWLKPDYFITFMEISKDIRNSEELWKMNPQGNLEDDSYSVK